MGKSPVVKARLAILAILMLSACVYDPVHEGVRCGPRRECLY
jgi:hypothetical protein